MEPNSALLLEGLKNTNSSNRTNSPVGLAAGELTLMFNDKTNF